MADAFASGRIVDVILILTVLEGAALYLYRRVTGKGVPFADLAAMLLAGLFLMLGLRLALTGAAWPWLALCLSGALVAHLMDLRRRWPRAGIEQ